MDHLLLPSSTEFRLLIDTSKSLAGTSGGGGGGGSGGGGGGGSGRGDDGRRSTDGAAATPLVITLVAHSQQEKVAWLSDIGQVVFGVFSCEKQLYLRGFVGRSVGQ